MQVLIVDDEPIARDILETYLLKMGIPIAGKCKNALEAFGMLSKQPIDLALLDINMPEISGVDFIKSLKNPPLVIFTTAYSEYAVESYELNAVDYLVKPVSFDRFMKAVDKAKALLQPAPPKSTGAPAAYPDQPILFVKSEGKLVKTDLSHLWLIEGLRDYVRLWTDTGKIIVHTTMKNLEEQLLPFPWFIRVSKSYIINLRYINEVDGNTIRIKDQSVVIGNTYRDAVYEVFDKHKLL